MSAWFRHATLKANSLRVVTWLTLSFWVAFGAGLLSFFSPCVVPLIPTYVAFLAGTSVTDLQHQAPAGARSRLLTNALLFILGFSLLFIAFGLTATGLGRLLLTHQELLKEVGGALIVLFGLHLSGILRLPFLEMEKRLTYTPSRSGPLSSLLIGMAFSAGWTACIGPILGSILLLASQQHSTLLGGLLLATYSLGLGLPFLAVGFSLNWFLPWLRRHGSLLPKITVASGVIMIFLGLLVFTGRFDWLSGLL